VPQATRDLTHAFIYNDLSSLEAVFQSHAGQIAAVILEPMNVARPAPGFLEGARDLSHKHGAVLVFDETITGFRYANGGAQALFGVTPDLATLGKGIANGYPVSAVVGRADLMKLMEEIFFSFTFGGETLSLAASLATLKKVEREPVVETMTRRGEKILSGLEALIAKHDATHLASLAGHPTWSFFMIKDAAPYTSWQLKTLFLQEMFSRGILTIGTHNLSYAHTDDDVTKLLDAYDEVLPLLVSAVRDRQLEKMLLCKPLEPLFKVR
jgi:glutamate-1-semialdehyde 2,1-aminomutase